MPSSSGRAVAELMYCDFMSRTGDEIFNQMSKWQAMSVLKMPLVLRVSVGSIWRPAFAGLDVDRGAHPGLKVMFGDPTMPKGMLNLALHGLDPVDLLRASGFILKPGGVGQGGVPTVLQRGGRWANRRYVAWAAA